MAEQLPVTTRDTSARPTMAEAIKLLNVIIDSRDAERMLREYQEGQAIVAEDARLELDTAECIQHQQLVAEQIQKNEQRRWELAPQLAVALQLEADLQALIEGFAKLAYGEAVAEAEALVEEAQPSLVVPPRPSHPPKQLIERRLLGEFRNTTAQRPLGKVAIVQGTLKTAVRGK